MKYLTAGVCFHPISSTVGGHGHRIYGEFGALSQQEFKAICAFLLFLMLNYKVVDSDKSLLMSPPPKKVPFFFPGPCSVHSPHNHMSGLQVCRGVFIHPHRFRLVMKCASHWSLQTCRMHELDFSQSLIRLLPKFGISVGHLGPGLLGWAK